MQLSLEVKGVKASTSLQQLWDEHKSNEEISMLPFTDTIKEADKTYADLEALCTSMKLVTVPCDIKEKEAVVNKGVEAFLNASKQLEEYATLMKEILGRAAKNTSGRKKSWRNARDYMKLSLEKTSVPTLISRSASTTMQADLWDPNDMGLPYTFYNLQFSIQPDKVAESLAEPALITSTNCVLHEPLSNFIDNDRAPILKKIDQVIAVLQAQKKTHAVGTVDAKQPWDWAAAGKDVFDCPGDSYSKHVLLVLENSRFDVTPEGFGFMGMSMIVTCITGFLYVSVASPQFVKNAGSDWALYISQADSLAFDDIPSFILKEGESAWIPFGHFPCIMSMPNPDDVALAKKKARAKKCVAEDHKYGVASLLLCPNLRDADDKAASTRFLADHMRGGQSWPASLSKHESFVKWKAKLEESQ